MPHAFTLTIDETVVAGADEIDAKTLATVLAHVARMIRQFGPRRAFERMHSAAGKESLEPILFREIDDAPGATHVETIRTH